MSEITHLTALDTLRNQAKCNCPEIADYAERLPFSSSSLCLKAIIATSSVMLLFFAQTFLKNILQFWTSHSELDVVFPVSPPSWEFVKNIWLCFTLFLCVFICVSDVFRLRKESGQARLRERFPGTPSGARDTPTASGLAGKAFWQRFFSISTPSWSRWDIFLLMRAKEKQSYLFL